MSLFRLKLPHQPMPSLRCRLSGSMSGLNSLIALSPGPKIGPPRLAKKQAKRLRRLERQKARQRKGSVNRRRTVARLNRVHARLAARRQDFTHKLTRTLIDRHLGLAVEKLRLKGLMRTRLAKSFADAGIGEMLRQLRYKAEWAGRNIVKCRPSTVLPGSVRSADGSARDCRLPCASGAVMAAARCTIATWLRRR